MPSRLKDIISSEIKKDTTIRDRLRAKRKRSSNSLHLVFIKHLCPHRVTVKNCKEHKILISGKNLTMSCRSILGTDRTWVFQLDKFFKGGEITIELTEKWFNLMMINITPGPLEIQKRRLIIARRHVVEFQDMIFEEVATWNRNED